MPGPNPIATVSELNGLKIEVEPGMLLRCGGYSYRIETIRGALGAPLVGLELVSEFAIRPGMKLRRSDSPLENDEIASCLMRVSQLLFQLAEVDVEGTLQHLRSEQPDLLCDYLRLQKGLEPALAILTALHGAKGNLPSLSDQRHVAQLARLLSERLSVIQLANQAPIGS